ncbi:MAG: hypothetical protein ACLTWK_12120 [Eisenbergiella sp.]
MSNNKNPKNNTFLIHSLTANTKPINVSKQTGSSNSNSNQNKGGGKK